MSQLKSYAVKKAEVRPAGKVQKTCLVINLNGTSFGAASEPDKIKQANNLITHVGISKKRPIRL